MSDVTPELEAIAAALDEAFTKDELLAYADDFGVEVKTSQNKRAVTLAYATDGVTVELIQGLTPAAEDEDDAELEGEPDVAAAPVVEEVDEADLVLVKMVRENHSYEVRGHKFTKRHPFKLVTEDDADYLCEVDGGFVMGTPKEARAYYS